MRIKIITVLFFMVIMSGFAVAQSTTSGSSTGSSTSSSTTNSGSFLPSSSGGVQVPSNSGIGNVPIQSVTPSTSIFNSQNLNSPSAVDSVSIPGTPSVDDIISTQNDLISSTSSFLNGTTTTNTRTQTSVLGETIFGDTLIPGMTNIPIVNVVPSTGTGTGTTTSTNSSAVNPQ
jgi:hypothetical protein